MMPTSHKAAGLGRFVVSGALAGAFSAFIFAVVHQFLISPIWFAVVAMLVAGAVCGGCLAWSYVLAVKDPTVRTWLRYNTLYLLILVALGITSVSIFTPVTTIAELLESSEPPRALIAQAFPVTATFTGVSAALLVALYRPAWDGAAAILTTTLVIVLVLGMNISILGFVVVPKSSLYVIGEVVVLIVTLALIYVVTMAYLCRSAFRRDRAA
jgi:hypothetical protein